MIAILLVDIVYEKDGEDIIVTEGTKIQVDIINNIALVMNFHNGIAQTDHIAIEKNEYQLLN